MLHSKAFAARGTFGGHRRTRSAVKQAVCHAVMLLPERLKQAAAIRRLKLVHDSKNAQIAVENASAAAPTQAGFSSAGSDSVRAGSDDRLHGLCAETLTGALS